MKKLLFILCALILPLAAFASHDIRSLDQWGPYSKRYHGISHIDNLSSGIKVEFCIVPGQYRRNFRVPFALSESGAHPWYVSPDMKIIRYRQDLEWKDRIFVDVTYHILDSARVLVSSRCVNNTDIIQNVNLQLTSFKSGGGKGEWTPETVETKGCYMVKYPEVEPWYGVAWNFPLSTVRQFLDSKMDVVMPLKVHEHVRKHLKGDMKGCITANFLRPITLKPHTDTVVHQLIVCGKKDAVERETAAFNSDEKGYVGSLAAIQEEYDEGSCIPSSARYAFGVRLLGATLLTNVVYPLDAFGEPVRHFGPGKLWNSFYTWDCGFIGWAMSEIAPMRGYEIIKQYTTSPEEEAPFVYHGSPLATQIFAIGDVWRACGCDEALLREIYPRLKRFYDNMTGPDYRTPSGLLNTWMLFYNSGGWDDYCPQDWVRWHKDMRTRVSPMVITSYYIRCAKILRLISSHLGLKKDVKQYDSDIKTMGGAILANAWDEDAGYFGYVVCDENGVPEGLLRTKDGVNYNMGLDGVTPLVAGIASGCQNERMLSHIFTPGELWSDCGITAIDQKSPYYSVDGYWNGTVWMPHQMVLWKTMLDMGLADKARLIAYTALDKWEEECEDSYNCYEHFMIESGRGGGWNNFSGLSSPILNWFRAYFKPGTLSTGFGVLASNMRWTAGNDGLKADLEFDSDMAGRKICLLACVKPGVEYSATINGVEAEVASPSDGQIEISFNVPKKRISSLEIRPSIRKITGEKR